MKFRSKIILMAINIFIYIRHPKLVKRIVLRMGYFPNPALPRRSTEKYLWRKLFDHDPRMVELTDKLSAKNYMRNKFPDIGVARVFWQGEDAKDIPSIVLQNDCIIKTNHGSSMNYFVRDGNIDRVAMEKKLSKWMQFSYGKRHHEWAYTIIKPKVFVEELLFSETKQIYCDYKFYMCGDRFIYCYVCIRNIDGIKIYGILDINGSSIKNKDNNIFDDYTDIKRPKNWNKLLAAAIKLSSSFDHVRCDLYDIGGQVFLSEFTFYPAAGYEELDWYSEPMQHNESWNITRSWFLKNKHHGWKSYYATALLEALKTPKSIARKI